MKISLFLKFAFCFLLLSSCGFHKPHIVSLPATDKVKERTLFFAVDGIGYDLISELKKEGYFKDFEDPIPLIVTFPSATTAAFSGIFQGLKAEKAPGYEVRFYSYEEGKITGGTPSTIYKIPIPYKHYFDSFRHTMTQKSMMYTFPGMSGRQDLQKAEKLLYESDKKILFAYLGGTDGAQHLFGRARVKSFMKFLDGYVVRMVKKYEESGRGRLRLVFFSDHGFGFGKLKMISTGDVQKHLDGYEISSHLKTKRDVVPVLYGLLSAGVLVTQPQEAGTVARQIRRTPGIELAFWQEKNRIFAVNAEGDEAYFEYAPNGKRYRYVSKKGDPLKLSRLLRKKGYSSSASLADDEWFRLTSSHEYPDPGHRLYAAFNTLVKNPGTVLFSNQPGYQFGSGAALAGTYLKFGQKGTHGSIRMDASAGMAMTNDKRLHLPKAVRYDHFFDLFLPEVTRALQREMGRHSQH